MLIIVWLLGRGPEDLSPFFLPISTFYFSLSSEKMRTIDRSPAGSLKLISIWALWPSLAVWLLQVLLSCAFQKFKHGTKLFLSSSLPPNGPSQWVVAQ